MAILVMIFWYLLSILAMAVIRCFSMWSVASTSSFLKCSLSLLGWGSLLGMRTRMLGADLPSLSSFCSKAFKIAGVELSGQRGPPW